MKNIETFKVTDQEDDTLEYVINGWMRESSAYSLTTLPLETRNALADSLLSLTEQPLEPSQHQRIEWVTRLLKRDEITEGARTTFVHTVSERAKTGYKSGMGTRAFTEGAHSSGQTLSDHWDY